MDLDWLARETLAINSHLNHFMSHDEQNRWMSRDDQEELSRSFIDRYQADDDIETLMFPEKPGLIWRLESFDQVFCLRSFATSNAQESYQLLKSGDSKLLRKLRIDSVDLSHTFFFETESMARAEIISDAISNQRFPYREEVVSNLSDPSVHWKLERLGSSQIRIHFQNIGSSESGAITNLGPLGSSHIFRKRCYHLFEKFGLNYDLVKLDADDRFVDLSFSDSSPYIPRFIEFFERGLSFYDQEAEKEELDDDHDLTTFLYFSELASLRRLWLQVQSIRKRFLS